MKHFIQFSAGSVRDLQDLPAHLRASVVVAIERHLVHQPDQDSKSRIKRLRSLLHPQYRLRVGDIRVFYDIVGDCVEIAAVIPKHRTENWLAENSTPEIP